MSTIVTRSGKGSPLTHAEVDSNFTNLNTDKLELSGGTLTGTLNFGDNVKAQFGAGSDLQIYHDGTDSYIQDAGSGNLVLTSNFLGVHIKSSTLENMAQFNVNDAVKLYFDNSKKIETTSSGVKVYDRLNVDLIQSSSHGSGSELDFDDDVDPFGTGQKNFTTLRSIGGLNLVFDTNDNDANGFFIGQNSGDTSLATKHLFINGDGDISFYEDTGTTAKFFWDASTERLGIGTTSPSKKLEVNGDAWFGDASNASTSANLQVHSNAAGGPVAFGDETSVVISTNDTNAGSQGYIGSLWFGSQDIGASDQYGWKLAGMSGYMSGDTGTGGGSADLLFYTASSSQTGTERMRVKSSGNLEMTGGGSIGWANYTFKEDGGYLYVYNGATKIMRVDASGNAAFAGNVEANATL